MEEGDRNEELFGAPARHSKYKAGELVKYRDPEAPGGIGTGKIIYCVERQEERSLTYMVLPYKSGFPVPVLASDIIEPLTHERTR